MKRREKRLTLRKETVRELVGRDLPEVLGGGTSLRCTTSDNCTGSCYITVCEC